jgi:hypothetical protein
VYPLRKPTQHQGFPGFVPTEITIFQLKNTPRGGDLTPPAKAMNRRLSSIRIGIEDAMGGVKR